MKNFAIIIIYDKKDGRSRLDYILMICQWHLRVGVSVKKNYLPMQNSSKRRTSGIETRDVLRRDDGRPAFG